MIAQVWKTSVLIKENLLGKIPNEYRILDQETILKILFSLKITKHLKTNRMSLFAL